MSQTLSRKVLDIDSIWLHECLKKADDCRSCWFECLHESFGTEPELARYQDADDPTDLTRTKRVMANRQSARQSRLRKMRRISLLDQMVQNLQLSISELEPRRSRLQGKHFCESCDSLAALCASTSDAAHQGYLGADQHCASDYRLTGRECKLQE